MGDSDGVPSTVVVPPGIVGVCTDPEGRFVASAAEFGNTRPGGFTLKQAQQHHVRRKMHRAILNTYCSTLFGDCIDDYDLEGAIRRLTDKGWKITYIDVGGEEEASKTETA